MRILFSTNNNNKISPPLYSTLPWFVKMNELCDGFPEWWAPSTAGCGIPITPGLFQMCFNDPSASPRPAASPFVHLWCPCSWHQHPKKGINQGWTCPGRKQFSALSPGSSISRLKVRRNTWDWVLGCVALLNSHVLFENTMEKPVSLFFQQEKALNTQGSEEKGDFGCSQRKWTISTPRTCWKSCKMRSYMAFFSVPWYSHLEPSQIPEVPLCARTLGEGWARHRDPSPVSPVHRGSSLVWFLLWDTESCVLGGLLSTDPVVWDRVGSPRRSPLPTSCPIIHSE